MGEPVSIEARWRDLFVPVLRVPLGVLCTGVLLHSMNALLMSTVMPSAVKDIGGLEYMAWPSTAFLATSVIAASAGSVVRAAVGGRAGYALAALMFGLGSLIAGLAPGMGWLVFGRAVQGVGGGLISSLAYVMVRNVFPAILWPRTFALFSSIWGIAVLIGPLIGGVFASLGFWRGAFLVVAVIAITLTLLAFVVLPRDADRPDTGVFPGFRLSLVALGIVMLSLAAPADSALHQVVFMVLALGVFVAMLWLDRRAEAPLLPSDAFTLTTQVGLGVWVLFLITAANDAFPIYGPMFLQTLHGMSPLSAGYLVAMEAMSWTLVAAIAASTAVRWHPLWIRLGPFVMGLGLVGISGLLESGPMWALLVAICFAGGGIGGCFSFVTQAILRGARDGEGDAAASAVATVQLVGLGVGAAIAGLVANVTGFRDGLSVDTASTASAWVPAVFVAATLAAAMAGQGLAKWVERESTQIDG